MNGGIVIEPIWIGLLAQAAAFVWGIARTFARIDAHERRITILESTISATPDRLARIETRLDHIDANFNRVLEYLDARPKPRVSRNR